MTALLKTIFVVFLEIMICKKAPKRWFGLILPLLCVIGSLRVIIPAVLAGVPDPFYYSFIIFNDYTIEFILTIIIFIFSGNKKALSQETSSAAQTFETTSEPKTEKEEMTAELKNGIETTVQIFKDKKFQEEVKDGIFSATTLTIGLMIGAALIGMIIMMFMIMDNVGDSHKERLAEEEKMTYNGHVYREFVPEEDSLWYTGEYVNLVNLEIKPLAYTCETRTGFDKPEKDYYLSTIDNIEAPTEEYTLSYHVCSNVDASYIDKAEQEFLDDFEGTPVEPQFDYGADTAYWLDDELLLRYGDNHLLYFYDDTTEELINNEETAAFMRDNMLLEKPFEKVNTLDYVFGKKGPKQE